ncbi:hypothetical protein MHZ92_19285 [Sporosarcina sp. ACRSL]|uniref:hypothetical protein n=1 Tax=Sporosarcina sp. ACRSL TaxID=2918215 RepID=UPI001EF4B653|nr:hypothetical protein [Sporosarcina sp. ACRSL]MCG7346255.1 hypothetical protein [Sporosarcina sp. ACRSL]
MLPSLPSNPKYIHQRLNRWPQTKKFLFIALLAALAALLQSAGGLLPGIGFAVSPFATVPIMLVSLISVRYGVFTYVVTILLLFVIESSELLIFPFTTGLLGLGLGWSFYKLNRRPEVVLVNGLLLCIGICIPLYLLGFPVFGPTVSSSFNLVSLLLIFTFSLLYSWIFMELSLLILRKLKAIIRSH